MEDRIFFDTNILYYAYDTSEPKKRDICEKLLEKVSREEIRGVVSNQILGELSNISSTKLGIASEELQVIVDYITLSSKWEKVDYTCDTVKRAVSGLRESKTNFWDLVIAETMKENGITEIITENEKDFARVSGIRVINPFKG